MAVVKPLINYAGNIKQIAAGDNLSNVIAPDLAAIQAMGSPFKALPVGFSLAYMNASFTMTTTRVYWQAVWLPIPSTITGLYWFQGTAGVYTASNYNGVGLYSYSGGTLTLVASSTDDGTIWKATSNTWANKAFSSTYSAASGLYFTASLYCQSAQTTAPILIGSTGVNNSSQQTFVGTNSSKVYGFITALTALPSSQAMSGVGVTTGTQAFFAPY